MCNIIQPGKLAFKHITLGGEFYSNGFEGARLKKVSTTHAEYVTAGYDDTCPAPVGFRFELPPEQAFDPINHV